jgi:GNAT superfamily N-acetyltransferase
VLRAAVIDDAPGLAHVHLLAWRATYRGVMPDDFLDGLDQDDWTERWHKTLTGDRPPEHRPEDVIVAADASGEIIGFAVTGRERAFAPDCGERGELWAINLVPSAWGTGAGTQLLEAAERALLAAGHGEAVLWVVSQNARARRFYERSGWHPDGIEKHDDARGFPLHELRYARTLVAPRP